MIKKILSLTLAMIMAIGLAAPAMAAGPTFSDVPESYWGYADIEAVAQAGYMNGTGNGAFSPEMKVSVAQFLTLLGRLVFPDVKTEGADWFGPYVAKAQEAGLLAGTQVDTGNVEAEISRYDMAVILRAAGKQLGVAEKAAQSSEVTDYGEIPTKYAEAVLAVYGMGFIRGDQAGNFNGSNTMMRAEVATVIMRLAKAKPGSTTNPGVTTSSEPSTTPEVTPSPAPEIPAEPELMKISGWMRYDAKGDPKSNGTGVANVSFQLRYTENSGADYTVIAEGITGTGNWRGDDTPGYFQLTTYVEKSIFDKFWNGDGLLYISAETTVNGKKYVTQDRRTDGKALVVPFGKDWNYLFVEIVPADRGETVEIPVVAIVNATTYVGPADGSGQIRYYGSGNISIESVLTNSTVKIYFDPQQPGVDPVLIWKTTADGGLLEETITIDTAYYRTSGEHYIIEAEAMLDGQLCKDPYYSLYPISLTQLMGEGSGLAYQCTITSDEFWEIGLNTSRPVRP